MRERIAEIGELIQDRRLPQDTPSGIVALTKEIPQAEFDRVLNSIHTFDRGVHVSWLRVLQGI
jgi:hypothetical protein